MAESNFLRKISTTLYYVLFLGIILLMVISLFSGNDIRGVESNVIYSIQQVLVDNSELYQNPSQLPYSITQYTPLYYVLCDLVLSILGTDPYDVFSIRFISKLVSFTFFLATIYVIYKILKNQFKLVNFDMILVISLFILISFPWFTISRPDVLVSFFLVLSLYFIFAHIHKPKPIYIIFIGILSSLAFLAKQSGLLFGFIFGLYLVFNFQWINIIRFIAGLLLGLFLLVFFFVFLGYDFTFFKENVIDGVTDFSWQHALKSTYKDFLIYYVVFIFGLFVFLNRTFKWHSFKQNLAVILLGYITIMLFLFSVFFALKSGSGLNYFNDFMIVALLLFAYVLKINQTYAVVRANKLLYFICLVGIQISVIHYVYYGEKILKGIYEEHVSENSLRFDITNFLKDHIDTSYFYSEDRKLNLLNFQHCILPQVEIHEAALHKNSFNYASLKADLYNGKIKYLILYSDKLSILNIDLTKHFVFDRKIESMHIYKYYNNSAMNK